MTEAINYDSLLILSLFAFITPIIIHTSKKFKIPFVVGEILVGIIIGKSFLNLVREDVWISFLSNLGLAYLMFLSGLEIEVEQLRIGKGPHRKKAIMRILLAGTMLLLSLLLSYSIAVGLYHMGLIKNISFIALLFIAAAPGLLVPFLKERGILNTDYGQTLLIFSLLCEFICLISLTIVSSTITYGLDYKSFLFVLLLLAAILLYKMIKKFSPRFDLSAKPFSRLHIGVRAAFALMLVLVTISHKIDTEVVLGSFLAGVIFTLILDKEKDELKYELDIIGYGFLIPIYFIMVGVNMDLSSVFHNPSSLLHIPIYLLIIFTIKFIPALLMTFFYGWNKAIAGGFILSGQLSVLIVGAQLAFKLNIISASNYSAFILITLISCILFPFCFDKIFNYEGIAGEKRSITHKISILEVIPLREEIFYIPLKELRFPSHFRIFMLLRDGQEILPDGETTILPGDRLLIAGLSDHLEEIMDILKG